MLPVAPIELAEFLLGASQADLESFDLAEPAFGEDGALDESVQVGGPGRTNGSR